MSLPSRSNRPDTNALGPPRPISMTQQIDMSKANNFQLMFKQINFTLHEAISKVEDIYNRFDVRFPIRHQLETVMRILTPIELKGMIDNREVYFLIGNKNEAFGRLHTKRNQQDSEWTNFHGKSDVAKESMLSIYHTNSQDNSSNEYFQDHRIKKHLKGGSDFMNVNEGLNMERDTGDRQSRKKKGMRSRGLQEHLCQWIMECYDSGRQICKADVIEKARKMGRDYNLKASVGWYSNFINRNLQIKQILVSSNYKKRVVDSDSSSAQKGYRDDRDFGPMYSHQQIIKNRSNVQNGENNQNPKQKYFKDRQYSQDYEGISYDDENQVEDQNIKQMSVKNEKEEPYSNEQSEDDPIPLQNVKKIK